MNSFRRNYVYKFEIMKNIAGFITGWKFLPDSYTNNQADEYLRGKAADITKKLSEKLEDSSNEKFVGLDVIRNMLCILVDLWDKIISDGASYNHNRQLFIDDYLNKISGQRSKLDQEHFKEFFDDCDQVIKLLKEQNALLIDNFLIIGADGKIKFRLSLRDAFEVKKDISQLGELDETVNALSIVNSLIIHLNEIFKNINLQTDIGLLVLKKFSDRKNVIASKQAEVYEKYVTALVTGDGKVGLAKYKMTGDWLQYEGVLIRGEQKIINEVLAAANTIISRQDFNYKNNTKNDYFLRRRNVMQRQEVSEEDINAKIDFINKLAIFTHRLVHIIELSAEKLRYRNVYKENLPSLKGVRDISPKFCVRNVLEDIINTKNKKNYAKYFNTYLRNIIRSGHCIENYMKEPTLKKIFKTCPLHGDAFVANVKYLYENIVCSNVSDLKLKEDIFNWVKKIYDIIYDKETLRLSEIKISTKYIYPQRSKLLGHTVWNKYAPFIAGDSTVRNLLWRIYEYHNELQKQYSEIIMIASTQKADGKSVNFKKLILAQGREDRDEHKYLAVADKYRIYAVRDISKSLFDSFWVALLGVFEKIEQLEKDFNKKCNEIDVELTEQPYRDKAVFGFNKRKINCLLYIIDKLGDEKDDETSGKLKGLMGKKLMFGEINSSKRILADAYAKAKVKMLVKFGCKDQSVLDSKYYSLSYDIDAKFSCRYLLQAIRLHHVYNKKYSGVGRELDAVRLIRCYTHRIPRGLEDGQLRQVIKFAKVKNDMLEILSYYYITKINDPHLVGVYTSFISKIILLATQLECKWDGKLVSLENGKLQEVCKSLVKYYHVVMRVIESKAYYLKGKDKEQAYRFVRKYYAYPVLSKLFSKKAKWGDDELNMLKNAWRIHVLTTDRVATDLYYSLLCFYNIIFKPRKFSEDNKVIISIIENVKYSDVLNNSFISKGSYQKLFKIYTEISQDLEFKDVVTNITFVINRYRDFSYLVDEKSEEQSQEELEVKVTENNNKVINTETSNGLSRLYLPAG